MSKKHPEEIRVPQIRFLGEQDGSPEQELKSCLIEHFRRDQIVGTAYLARVAYGNESFAVALCLRSQFGPDQGLAEKIGSVFASMFGTREQLDIIFLSETQEAELVTVCKSFFQTGHRNKET